MKASEDAEMLRSGNYRLGSGRRRIARYKRRILGTRIGEVSRFSRADRLLMAGEGLCEGMMLEEEEVGV